MRGNITRRGKKSWRIKYDVGAAGERVIQYQTVHGTKRDAETELAKRLTELADGRYVPPTVETVETYARYWLTNIAPVDRSPLTLARYRSLIEAHIIPGIGDIPLKNLDGKCIDAFYADRRTKGKRYGGGLSSASMANLHRLLTLILKSAVKAKKLAASPIADVQTKPKPKRRPIEVLSESELAALLNHLDGGPLYYPTLLSANTALRRAEICGLRWRDLNFESGTLHVAQQVQKIRGELVTLIPKSDRSRRTIRVPETVMRELEAHRANQAASRLQLGLGKSNYVFTDELGRQLDPDAFSKSFIAEARAVRRMRFHDLRHTHLTHLLRNGVPVHIVSARAGHSSPTITLTTYAHLIGGDDERAAEQAEAILKRLTKK